MRQLLSARFHTPELMAGGVLIKHLPEVLLQIATMSEPTSGILRGNGLKGCGNGFLQSFGCPGCYFAQVGLDFGEGLLNGVEIG